MAYFRRKSLLTAFAATWATLCLFLTSQPGKAQFDALRPYVLFMPKRAQCSQILELEKLNIPLGVGTIMHYNDGYSIQLLTEYFELAGWLEGYMTAVNAVAPTLDGHIGERNHPNQWIIWLFSYCRANLNAEIGTAAVALVNSLYGR